MSDFFQVKSKFCANEEIDMESEKNDRILENLKCSYCYYDKLSMKPFLQALYFYLQNYCTPISIFLRKSQIIAFKNIDITSTESFFPVTNL